MSRKTGKTRKNKKNDMIIRDHDNKESNEKTSIFTEKEYNSNDGFLTKIWGVHFWTVLHTMSFNYPVVPTEEDKKQYRDFILSLKYVLPCGKCRKNLVRNFKKLPITMKDMENRETFSKYVYNLHELINKMLCKKSHLSYEDVRERYEHFRSRCRKKRKTIKKSVKKIEKGCTEPVYGEKSKTIIRIVPEKKKCETFEIDKKCVLVKERKEEREKDEKEMSNV